MSPTRIPGQPASLCALADSRFSSATMSGWPQLRLRDSRITCQVSPLIGIALGAGDAALGIEADHPRRHRRRQHLAGEQLLGADLGIVGIGQRRQRLWIDAALVLRQRGGGAGDDGGATAGERESGGGSSDHSMRRSLAWKQQPEANGAQSQSLDRRPSQPPVHRMAAIDAATSRRRRHWIALRATMRGASRSERMCRRTRRSRRRSARS